MKNKCRHPAARHYAVTCRNERLEWVQWIGCLDCGEGIGEIPLPQKLALSAEKEAAHASGE